MDRETLANYGWLVVVILVLSIMISLATPFARAIKDNFIGVADRLTSEIEEAFSNIGHSGAGGGESGGDSGGGTPTLEQLATPTVELNNGILTITDTTGKTEDFEIRINGEVKATVSADSGSFDLSTLGLAPGMYSITVIAKGTGCTDSAESAALNYEVKNEYDHSAPELHPAGTITEGTYYVGVSSDQVGSYTGASATYTTGDAFPSRSQRGDVYVCGDYEYRYDYNFSYGRWQYKLLQGWGVRVLDATQDSYGKILESINGAPVRSVSSTFHGCTSLTTAPIIPSSVTYMGDTFSGCTSLTTASEIPNGVKELYSTFSNCTALTTVPEISNGVKSMESTFYNCKSLRTAPIIPSSVTEMKSTFSNCTALATAPVIPGNVTNMQGIFSGCTSLTTAPVIPANVTNMQGAFSGCTALTTAPVIPSKVTNMWNTFSGCAALKTYAGSTDPDGDFGDYVIPEKVTNMLDTFNGCASLTTAPAIPSGITSLSGTFEGCTSLTTAPVIPSSVTNILDIFSGCTALKTYVGSADPDGDFGNYIIPEGVTNMNHTFKGCTSLTAAPVIPANVTNIQGTFSGCTALKTYAGSTDPDGDFGNYVIPEKVTSMNCTFEGCTSLTTAPAIPNSVTDISCTFEDCVSLATAPVIPSGVTNMNDTFNGCTSLTTAPVIPSGVTKMIRTFAGCTSLSGVITINTNNISGNNNPYASDRSSCYCFKGVDMTKITLTGEASKAVLNLIGSTGNNWTPLK